VTGEASSQYSFKNPAWSGLLGAGLQLFLYVIRQITWGGFGPRVVVANFPGAPVDMDQHNRGAECRLDLIPLPAENARRFFVPRLLK
jgi:hypothetical protein